MYSDNGIRCGADYTVIKAHIISALKVAFLYP